MNRKRASILCALILFAGEALPTADGKPADVSSIEQTSRDNFGSDRARKTLDAFPSRGTRTDHSIPPKSPGETVATFKLAAGLKADVVLHEPLVRQPVFLNFDERGRMWVVQFLQYPYPAGLKIVDFDDQFHAVYDKVPSPPPNHERGADKITIHEDADGDGTFETHKVFLEGLNMVTAVERGRGGVWVLNPPYLVFWPDRNRDDVVDGDPTIHLAGFGLEDTHSAANSLCWGPDGWLYGGQGSGVSSTITRPGLDDRDGLYFKGQAIWRYHPGTRAFELFAEGGGNTFGLEFDAAGRAWSGINGNNHRGFHFVQGGYYSKNFGEHGYFTNPHTFGYLSAMPHDREAPRFSHTFIVYEGGALGASFEGQLIAPVPLQNKVMLSALVSAGSTYATRDSETFLSSDDRWFRPVDIKTGPEGAVYLADWYDTRLSHMDPRDTWDRAHGRIYRVSKIGLERNSPPRDLGALSNEELCGLLSHTNKWFRQTALRLLWDRHDHTLAGELARLTARADNPRALDALWALHASGGLEAARAESFLSHRQSLVRAWAVRLIGELWGGGRGGLGGPPPSALPRSLAAALKATSGAETDAQVRSQLASTARRLSGETALDVIFNLTRHDADTSDPHIPLLLWWALEPHAFTERFALLSRFHDKTLWSRPLNRGHLLPRLARLYATVPTAENQEALAALLRSAPDAGGRNAIIDGINEAFKGGSARQLIAALDEALENRQGPLSGTREPGQLALALRRSEPGALREALAFVSTETSGVLPEHRGEVIEALGEARHSAAAPTLLEVLSRSGQPRVRQAALATLGRFDSDDIADAILARWSQLDQPLKRSALAVLSSRRSWALRLLRAAGGSGTISKADVPDEIALRLRLFRDPELTELCDRYFGKPALASTAEKQERIETLARLVRTAPTGNLASGKKLFAARCAVCHRLFGEGADTAPDLTGAERTNLENMLLSIIDPSVGIREGFTLFQFTTTDGRDLAGFIVERDARRVTLRDLAGQLTTLPMADVASERAIPASIMPERLLDDLSDREVVDLFGYLMAPAGK